MLYYVMDDDYKIIKYTIKYPMTYSFPEDRFKEEFIKKLDDFIRKELNGWLSVRCKKENEELII